MKLKSLSILLLAEFIFFPQLALAADFPAVTVTPAILKLDLANDPDTFNVTYENTSPSAVQLTFSARDFTGLEDNWRVKFLNTTDALNYHYTLSSWLEFSPPSLLLKSGETGTLTVKIRANSLSPGGHYASIIADIIPSPPPTGTIAMKSQLVSLIFVRAHTGHELEEGKISSLTLVKDQLFAYPKSFILRFQNTGNTELIPYGLVSVKDLSHKEIAQGILNPDSLITLPESIRRYDIPITVISNNWGLPGPQQATLTLQYGTNHVLTTSTRFFSLGGQYFQTLVALIFVLIIIGFYQLKKVKIRQHHIP